MLSDGADWHSNALDQLISVSVQDLVECTTCRHQRITENRPTPILKVNIPHASDSVACTLEELLHACIDEIDFEGECDNCKCQRKKKKQDIIMAQPDLLCIHINRTAHDFRRGRPRKQYNEVSFGSHLDIQPWCHPSISSSKSYKLLSIVKHFGNHREGHYITFTRIGDEWYELNDLTVTSSTEQDAIHHGSRNEGFQPLLLFYELEYDSKGSLPRSPPRSKSASPRTRAQARKEKGTPNADTASGEPTVSATDEASVSRGNEKSPANGKKRPREGERSGSASKRPRRDSPEAQPGMTFDEWKQSLNGRNFTKRYGAMSNEKFKENMTKSLAKPNLYVWTRRALEEMAQQRFKSGPKLPDQARFGSSHSQFHSDADGHLDRQVTPGKGL